MAVVDKPDMSGGIFGETLAKHDGRVSVWPGIETASDGARARRERNPDNNPDYVSAEP